jgi:hypothetical protein
MKKTLYKALPGLVLFFLAGCFNGLETTPQGLTEGKGLARISVGTYQRTLLPELPALDSLYYTLALDAAEQDPVSVTIPTGATSAEVELTAGTWSVTVRGFVSEADAEDETLALVQGSDSVEVNPGAEADLTVSLTLNKTQSRTGTLNYKLSGLEGLDTADLVIIPLSDGGTEALPINLLADGKDAGAIPLNAGSYRLSVSLSRYSADDAASVRAGKTAVVHIYDSLSTLWEDNVEDYAFYRLPMFETIEALLADIDEHAGTASENDPYYVSLRGAYEEADLNSLFANIKAKAKHITLDLADCQIEAINDSMTNPEYVVSLIMPRSLKTLGKSNHSYTNYVFLNWTKLKSVSFPAASALEILGSNALYNCVGLVSADLSGCVALKSITGAFYNCAALQSVKLPESLETIGEHTFNGCVALESVNMPASLKTIGNTAFRNCQALTLVKLPASLKTIGNNAFGNNTVTYACKNLDVDFSECRSLAAIGTTAFRGCTAITSVDLSGCIRLITIPDNTFNGCTSIVSAKLPEFLQTIGTGIFNGCTALAECVVYAEDPPALGANAFNNTREDLQIQVPAASVAAYQEATNWTAFSEKIIPIAE